MSLTGMLQWGTRQSTETGNLMTSVERVNEYSQLPSEAALESMPGFLKILRHLTFRYDTNEIH